MMEYQKSLIEYIEMEVYLMYGSKRNWNGELNIEGEFQEQYR